MKTMTQITLDIQKRVNRQDTLRLLARAGEVSRASDGRFAPAAVLALMQHRLEKGFTADKIAAMTNGKLIQQTRKYLERESGR